MYLKIKTIIKIIVEVLTQGYQKNWNRIKKLVMKIYMIYLFDFSHLEKYIGVTNYILNSKKLPVTYLDDFRGYC